MKRKREIHDPVSGGRPRAPVVLPALLLVAGLVVSPAAAQDPIEMAPGYFPMERFTSLPSEVLSLEINLSKNLLGLVAAAMEDEDPEFAGLAAQLEGIRVRGAPAAKVDLGRLRRELEEASAWLEANGWETMLRFRDEEEVFVYTRLLDGEMVGLALMVMEPGGDVVLVNIVGPLDLKLLAGLADSLDLPQLGLAAKGAERSSEEPR